MRRQVAFLLLFGIAAGAGCRREDPANGLDPIVALAAPTLSHRYDFAYWLDQCSSASHRCVDGMRFCASIPTGSEARYPNCKTLNRAISLTPHPPTPAAASSPAASRKGFRQEG